MAYRADIEIAVRGAQELKRLQDQVSATSKLVDGLNNYLQNIGDGGVVRSIDNLNKTVADTAAAFNKAALETDEAALAARNFVAANRQLTQGLEARLTLLKSITEEERRQRLGAAGIRETTQYAGPIGPGPASPVASLVGQKSPVEEIIRRTIEARKDERDLQEALLRLEEKSATAANKELQARGEIARMSAAGMVAATVRAGQPGTPLALPAFQERGLQLLNDSVRLNESSRRIEQAVNGERERGVRFLEKQTAEERRQVELGILGQRTNRLPGIRPDSGFIPPFPPKAKGMFQGIPAKGLAGFLGKPGVTDAMMGAGFPLLFGAAPGAVLGGGAGGFLGGAMGAAGGPAGMALGIALSAVGQILDQTFVKIADLSKAANMLNVDGLRDSVIVVNAELDYQVGLLKRAGQADEARALIAKAVFEQTGLTAGATERIANTSNLLGNAWDGVTGAVGGFVSILASGVIPALLPILKIVELVFKGWNMILSLIQDLAGAAAKWVLELVFGKELAERILNFFKGTNEESEKVTAALAKANDEQAKVTKRAKEALAIEKTRTNNVSLMGKLINIEADRRDKINDAENAAEDKRKAALEEFAGVTSAAGKARLAALLKEIDGEKKVAVERANIVALRQRELAQNADLIAADKLRITLLQSQGEIAKAREDATEKVRSAQIQELEQRKQLSLSLNSELAAVNAIYTQKKQGTDAAYAAAKREADLKVQTAAIDLASIENQKIRGQADDKQVATARSVYNTAVAVAQETLRGAAATQSAATSAADLERRQQTVAAYAGQYARNTQQASNRLNEQAAAIDNQTKLVQAQNQAYITINNIQIDSLRTQLESTKNEAQRAVILNQIRDLEINNATALLYTTRSQITAEVERQRIAYQQVQLTYLELKARVNIARAQGVLNQGYLDALESQRSALVIAKNNYETSQGIAKANWRAADAVYNAAVKAATLKSQTQGAAAAAGQFAGSMERATKAFLQIDRRALEPWQEQKIREARIAAIQNSSKTNALSGFIAAQNAELALVSLFEKLNGIKQQESNMQAEQEWKAEAAKYGISLPFPAFASGGYVTGPTLGLVGEGGQAEYIIPESKMAAASANYLAGGRGAGIMEGSGGGSAPSINITTGPVVEFNGERYVTMRDMERGLQQMATSIYSGLRTPAGRYATGVR